MPLARVMALPSGRACFQPSRLRPELWRPTTIACNLPSLRPPRAGRSRASCSSSSPYPPAPYPACWRRSPHRNPACHRAYGSGGSIARAEFIAPHMKQRKTTNSTVFQQLQTSCSTTEKIFCDLSKLLQSRHGEQLRRRLSAVASGTAWPFVTAGCNHSTAVIAPNTAALVVLCERVKALLSGRACFRPFRFRLELWHQATTASRRPS